MLGWNGSAWFSILMGAALKSTVVLGAAWLMAFLLRGRSAAARHLVWTAAAAAVLALPLLSVSLPALHVPVSAAHPAGNTGLVFRALRLRAPRTIRRSRCRLPPAPRPFRQPRAGAAGLRGSG